MRTPDIHEDVNPANPTFSQSRLLAAGTDGERAGATRTHRPELIAPPPSHDIELGHSTTSDPDGW